MLQNSDFTFCHKKKPKKNENNMFLGYFQPTNITLKIMYFYYIKIRLYLYILYIYTFFYVIKIHNLQGDLTEMLAKTITLWRKTVGFVSADTLVRSP